MVANINPKTGIPYGVISGNNVPYLLEEIMTNGENLTFESFKQELVDTICNILRQDDVTPQEMFLQLEKTIDEAGVWGAYNIAKNIMEDTDFDDLANLEKDIGSVVDCDFQFDSYQAEEEEYMYTDKKGNEFQLGWLGGAPLIWVLKSDNIVCARPCSPCVPNAGDLDNLNDGGIECYGLPVEWDWTALNN